MRTAAKKTTKEQKTIDQNKNAEVCMKNDNSKKILYTVSEVAELTGLGKGLIYALIDSGLLKALKIGGFKVRRETLEQFLADYDGCDLGDLKNIRKLHEDPAV